MIKIQPIVKEIVQRELEAYTALLEGYMNMSSYAYRIKPEVEERSKKKVTVSSLVVSLSRLRKELHRTKPLIHPVSIKNITTKLPISELVYENSTENARAVGTLPKSVSVSPEDLFTVTIGTGEIDIICSSDLESKILKHFKKKPKIRNRNLAAVGISYGSEVFDTPNVFFSLLAVTARAQMNIEELVSTPTELTFIVAEKDFGKTVSLFSEMRKKDML